MTIQLRPVALADLLPALQQHIGAFSAPIDSFLEDHILASTHYVIQSDETQIGWASVYEQRLLTQFTSKTLEKAGLFSQTRLLKISY